MAIYLTGQICQIIQKNPMVAQFIDHTSIVSFSYTNTVPAIKILFQKLFFRKVKYFYLMAPTIYLRVVPPKPVTLRLPPPVGLCGADAGLCGAGAGLRVGEELLEGNREYLWVGE